MLTILDVHDFAGPATGELRRYQAEKLAFMQGRADLRYVFVQPDVGTWTEARGRNLLIEHVEAPLRPLAGEDWALISGRRLRELVQLHRPGVIACGSPAVLPLLVRLASARLSPRAAMIGHWHGDLARDWVGRGLARAVDPRLRPLAEAGERAAWWWTKQGYAGLDAVLVPSRDQARLLWARGLDRLYLTPTGVDAERYTPARRSPELVARLRAGVQDRPILWTDAEPGVVAPIYAELCRRSSHDPAVVLAGDHGDDDEAAARERFAAARAHVHAARLDRGDERGAGDERGRWLASCDLALCRGPIACAEAMASELAIVTWAGAGAAERVREAGCGRVVRSSEPAVIAAALLELASGQVGPELPELGRRGRRWILRFDWASCFERELLCYTEAFERVRSGGRVPSGVHERMQPAALPEAGHEPPA